MGISLYVLPFSFLPVFFLFVPPHCLKKNGTFNLSHCSIISIAHSGFIGLGFLPLSPPTITQSIPFNLRAGKGPISGSQDKNFTLAFVFFNSLILSTYFSFSTETPIHIL